MGFFRRNRSSASDASSVSTSTTTTNDSTTNRRSAPGASSVGGNTSVFRVTVPENIRPGEEFQVYAGTRIVRVRCPMDTRPGQSLQISVPLDPTPPGGAAAAAGIGGGAASSPRDSPNVRRIEGSNPPAYMVSIPEGTPPGSQFEVHIQGQPLKVTCPPNAVPGMNVRIVPPPPPTDTTRPPAPDAPMGQSRLSNGAAALPPPPLPPKEQSPHEKTQLFEVEVPRGVQPGAPFALLAGGVRVLVTCPPNAKPGQRIRFKLPLGLTPRPTNLSDQAQIKLQYSNKDGWTRTVRATDLKFQWVRMDDNGDVDVNKRFHMEKSAYVRKLEFRQGPDPRVRMGTLTLVPATESVVDSKIKSTDGRDIVNYSDIAEAQVKDFEEKAQWFQDTCAQLSVEWNEGHMRMNVRRQYLLGDSVDAVMSLSRKDLRKLWRFEFIGEMGIDAGGLAREWFELVVKEIFDPDTGLWMSSTSNQMSMTINPASGTNEIDFSCCCCCCGCFQGNGPATHSFTRFMSFILFVFVFRVLL